MFQDALNNLNQNPALARAMPLVNLNEKVLLKQYQFKRPLVIKPNVTNY